MVSLNAMMPFFAQRPSGLLYNIDRNGSNCLIWDNEGNRQQALDFSLGTGDWFGATANSQNFYSLNRTNNTIMAFTLTGTRQSSMDIVLGTPGHSLNDWDGIAATETRMYVVWSVQNLTYRLIEYQLNGTRVTQNLNTAPLIGGDRGFTYMTIVGNRLYTIDDDNNRLNAHSFPTIASISSENIALGAGFWRGVAVIGTNIYIQEGGGRDIEVWATNGTRQSDLDFSIGTSGSFAGLAAV